MSTDLLTRVGELEARRELLVSASEQLAEAVATALVAGEEAAWETARDRRSRVLDERADLASAIDRLRAQYTDEQRARLAAGAEQHLAKIVKRAGGLRGETPRGFERATEALEDAVARFGKAASLRHELEQLRREALEVAAACGLQAPAIEVPAYGPLVQQWRELVHQRVQTAVHRFQRAPAHAFGDDTAALLDRAAALRSDEA